MWRYRELLPVIDAKNICSLGEGGTPIVELRATAESLDTPKLFLKDEGRNPTGSFKARGASVAVSRLAELGFVHLAMPTVGSGGSAWSAYAARAGLEMTVGLPERGNLPVIGLMEPDAYGARVVRCPGHIAEAFKTFRSYATTEGLSVVGAFLEPYRLEGEKTIGYEIAEQFDWRPPDWIVWPTGGGVGFIGLAKAFRELRDTGWLDGELPGLVVVQAEGCAPVVDVVSGMSAGQNITRHESIAPGITVPNQSFPDLMSDVMRDFRVLGSAVPDEQVLSEIRYVSSRDGLLLSPEGAAGIAGIRALRATQAIGRDESVVVINTATGLRYPHLLKDNSLAAVSIQRQEAVSIQ
jgi:threonine synthase